MNIETGVRRIVADIYTADAATLTSATVIQDELGGDSLDLIELAMALEDEFGFQIEDDEAESWKTVGDVEVTVGKRHQQ